MKNSLGEKLKALRGSKSVAEVAKEIGISQSALSMYENGQRIPRDSIKIRLARYYKTSIETLFYADK